MRWRWHAPRGTAEELGVRHVELPDHMQVGPDGLADLTGDGFLVEGDIQVAHVQNYNRTEVGALAVDCVKGRSMVHIGLAVPDCLRVERSDGDYPNDLADTEWATTPFIDCFRYVDITLSFYRWLGVENSEYDRAFLQVTNDGVTWHTVRENSETLEGGAWERVEYDLSPWADMQATVQVRWGMGPTDSSWRYCGWNIDDVVISGVYSYFHVSSIEDLQRIGRIFSLLDPVQFQDAFRNWAVAVQGRVVAVDGKTVRRSHDRGKGKAAIHVVSAWAEGSGMALGQVKVDDKSNEITAIPELLRVLDLKGCLVTADAMGCQREIAKNVIDAGADYLLAVKGNQETLAEDVEQEFKQAMADGFAHMDHRYLETLDKGHGRIEKRQYWYTLDIQGLGTAARWPGIAGMVMCRATRTLEGETTVEDRYYITSAGHGNVEKIADGVRRHWGIENKLHWVLDVAFDEDQSRIRIGHAAENMAALRKIALNALKKCKAKDGGVKARRKEAGWDNRYLEEVLMAV